MPGKWFADIAFDSLNCGGERICGDTFAYRRIRTEHRTVAVLSDGMGHGVKANVLSTLTASMMVNFAPVKEDIERSARIILNNLPVCSVRKISYSTFTVVDIDHATEEVAVAEHDNPRCIVLRGSEPLSLQREPTVIRGHGNRPQTVYTSRFIARQDDRIILVSDGITQSGRGTDGLPFGWGEERLAEFIGRIVQRNPRRTAGELAIDILNEAWNNDGRCSQDDMSCAVIHFREPKRVLLASCPPARRNQYREYTATIRGFDGTKILCGHPLAEIYAREQHADIVRPFSETGEPSPVWHIPGIDLTTEGTGVLSRLFDLLSDGDAFPQEREPAAEVRRLLLSGDEITLMMGTRKNAEESSYFPGEFELRRQLLRRIASLLENRYGKELKICYI